MLLCPALPKRVLPCSAARRCRPLLFPTAVCWTTLQLICAPCKPEKRVRAWLQRQKEMVKNLYAECMALEELLEESVHILGPDARDILAQIRSVMMRTLPLTQV